MFLTHSIGVLAGNLVVSWLNRCRNVLSVVRAEARVVGQALVAIRLFSGGRLKVVAGHIFLTRLHAGVGLVSMGW